MGISKKFTLVSCILAAILLIAAGSAQLVLREQEADAQLKAQSLDLAQLIAIAAAPHAEDHGELSRLAQLLSAPASLAFYDARGARVVPVNTDESPVVDARIRRVLERKQASELFSDARSPTFIYRAPLLRGEHAVGAFELRTSRQRATLAPRRVMWPIATLMLLGFGLAVWSYVRYGITDPLKGLMSGMDEVISGDLTAALPLDRNDEVGRIAFRFNEMTARLRAAQQEVQAAAEARVELEQTLQQSEKLATIGQLSAEIAHEVGTPLAVIGGRARVLERKAEHPDEVQKNARIIADQAERITKIIKRMLDLARARKPQRVAVDIRRAVDDALVFLEYQLREDIRVSVALPTDLPAASADSDALQQILLNLLLNAIQALPDGGTISVGAKEVTRRKGGLDLAAPQRYLQVSIADDGCGLTDEQRAQIFEPFYSTKARGEGTGLGLTVVRGIITDHDGWIEVDQAQPRGTVFRFYLPVADDQSQADQSPSQDR